MSLLGIDVGTTSCKAVVFNKYGEVLSSENLEHSLIYPKKGWVELDPNLIWENIKDILIKINHRIKKDKIKAFSVSCQGEAIIPIDKNGDSLHNAIVTFDNRTRDQYEFWKRTVGEKRIFEITGMPLHPMYSINKIMWIKRNLKEIYKRTYKFLCFEDYILMKFGLTPTIDFSLAARTMAFDVIKKVWSNEILKKSKICVDLLSEVKPSGEIVGEIDLSISNELGFGKGVIGVTGGHDQACGAFGAGIIKGNTAMNATGTSDVITAVLDRVLIDEKMLKNNYPCYPHVIKNKYITVSFNLTGGLLLKWFRDNFCYEEKIIAKKENKDVYNVMIDSMHPEPVNVFILPHFVGSGTPFLDSNSKGIIMGLDLESDKSKIVRAILESNTYDLKLNFEKLSESGIKINKIIAIGGGAKSNKWLKIKSDVLNKRVETIKNSEAASLGAALLAGIAIGEYKSFEDAVENTVKIDKSFSPNNKNNNQYNKRYLIYKDIYYSNRELLRRINKLD
jgi:xylulokinase